MAKSTKGKGGRSGGKSGGSGGRVTRPAAKSAARGVEGAKAARSTGTSQAKEAAAKAASRATGKAAKGANGKVGTEPVNRDTVGRRASERPADGAAAEGSARPPGSARPRPAPTRRTTPPASARYTPPVPKSAKVSPLWVPILMFSCLGLGMLTIILNYVNVLPGPDPSNGYLMAGLALITVGFITATKYH